MGFIAGSIAGDTQALPLQRIVESVMRGNAESQAQTQAKDLAGKQMDADSQLHITMKADPNDPGNPFVSIKNAKADQLNQTQGSDLQNAYDAPKKNVEGAIAKMNAPQPSAGEFEASSLRSVGYQPEPTNKTAADLSTYGQDYRAQRDLGEPIIKAALKAAIMRSGAWNRDKIAEELDRRAAYQNAAAFKATAEPILQEQDRQRTSNVATGTLLTKMDADRRGAIAPYLKPGALMSLTGQNASDPAFDPNEILDKVNAALGIRDENEKQLFANAIQKDRIFAQRSDKQEANKLVDGISTASIVPGQSWETKKAELLSQSLTYGGQLSQSQLAIAKDKFDNAQETYRNATALKRAEIQRVQEGNQLEGMRIQQQREAMKMQGDLAKLNTPEAIDQSSRAVLADGNQLYDLPDKTPLEKAYKAKVEASVRAQTGGFLPNKIAPGSDDAKTLAVVQRGRQDLAKIEEIYNKWQPIAPIGGPSVAALNKAIIENKPSSYLASVAMNVVPGYSSLSPAQRKEYLADVATAAHRMNALTVRDARAATGGGRMAVQMVDYFKGITPGFQNPDTFKGLAEGARQEFANAEAQVRNTQWSGHVPTAAPQQAKGDASLSVSDFEHWKKTQKKTP